jgi:hypothetical protein
MQFIINNWWQLILLSPLIVAPIVGLFLMVRDGDWILLLPILIIFGMVFGAVNLKAETYQYKNKLVIQASDYNTAAKLCFKALTKNKYPGEQKGLDIIDLCSNPVSGEVK